ncbi:MAG: ribonuclease HI [Desulfovibrio sp.]|uniref:ribonuclease HI n=1 Tax=Desulfovibrio sp. 7SRBS1 TaxID=3378064 RepID=UPI003B3D3B20
MADELTKVTIHTDGSCLGNPGPGGWAAVLEYSGHRKELADGYKRTTNNRMELLAVIESLASLKRACQVDLYTDSQYVRNAIVKKWLDSWQRKNWINSAKKPVKNKDLWLRLLPLLAKHEVSFNWLKGHAGHVDNERCDILARTSAERGPWAEDAGYPG